MILFCFNKYINISLFILLLTGCNDKKTVFEQLSSSATGITFNNHNEDTDSLNILDYLYYYNGAGVAAGDINNDGLTDLYFVANQGGNKLYLNKGNFKFEDITDKAFVKGNADWSTGVTMADVNGDGWLDIYVCTVANHTPLNAGHNGNKTFFINSKNQLFINNHNGTFTESAVAYGLDMAGYSTQSAFFDYDRDGDLDMFLLQHSIHQTDTYGDTSLRNKYSAISGCKLFRNDDNHFINVTIESKLFSSALGYGLGVAIADFNNDGWDDIYVGNDFHENDYYYINNKDGSFKEQVRDAFGHVSNFSMGNDAVDFNNDGQTDLITLDMLPPDEKILKSTLNDESFDEYENLHKQMGYYHQYSRNCLQLNVDYGKHFAEIGLYSSVAATDWSWAVLGADFNLDGHKDIFITNGIKRRLNDLDYIKFISNGEKINDKEMLNHMPEASWHNYMFINNGNSTSGLQFSDMSAQYGFTAPTLSQGCAYADLDNDGDPDLVINNMNKEAGIFKNTTIEKEKKSFISVKLNGPDKNKFGISAKLFTFSKNTMQYQQLQPVRGFMSSVEPVMHFGFDTVSMIDSIKVVWGDWKTQTIKNIKTNQHLQINYADAKDSTTDYALFFKQLQPLQKQNSFTDITAATGLYWKHNEDMYYNDFNRNPFIPHQVSTPGPALAIGDINKDGLDDIFAGGAKNQPSAIFIQTKSGGFIQTLQPVIASDSLCEDVQARFFDADNDGDIDLYVASGGEEFFGNAEALKDRLYLNDGKANFTRSTTLPALYENKSALAIADYDKDGDMDIFIGGRANSQNYGASPTSYLLNNDGKGNFSIVTNTVAGLENIGMVTAATWCDLNNDGYPGLIITGEFMAPTIYKNTKGQLSVINNSGITNLSGLWQSIFIADVNDDNQPDILLGNYGLNSKLTASEKYPLKLFCKDIDNNQNTDQILAIAKEGNYFTFLGKETLEKQLPYLKKEFLSYQKMAGKTVTEIFGNKLDGALELKANTLASVLLLNKGCSSQAGFNFDVIQLPAAFQWMPLFSFVQMNDKSIIAGGNFYGVLPYEGRYDNAILPMMAFNQNTLKQTGSLFAEGEVRNMQWINLAGNKKALVIARNNLPLMILELN